jgi:hypothetical protein
MREKKANSIILEEWQEIYFWLIHTRQEITEILLNVSLNTITLPLYFAGGLFLHINL